MPPEAITAREQIGELLGTVGAPRAFTARRMAAADDLHLEVEGLGPLRFPISRTSAQRLCRLARPARYGRGERTLLDKRVRDTWEIPKRKVKIDKRRWNRTLLPMLEALRGDLGLPESCKLKAELHSMLVYSAGQFFLPHQDSEKVDAMVATLVVTLPSVFKGGAFVVEHKGEKITYRATRQPLSFIAFYADCRHEVRPVKEGYRIVLTYNLMLGGDRAAAAAALEPATVDALAEQLRAHFETPRAPRSWEKDTPPREPPSRLVYLLDHEYTERGLDWSHLKGNDAARAAVLRAAAERLGCELVLALAEIQETWDCMEGGWDEPRYGRRRRWGGDDGWDDEDDEDASEDELAAGDLDDDYTLGDLQDRQITLNAWVDPAGKKADPIATSVSDDELCFTTPSSDLEPYDSEYEGNMGNWGNTMDRWYRRAAIVLWPREHAFGVRAEASPTWALETLKKTLRGRKTAEAREMAASLLPFWGAGIARVEPRGLFDEVLHVAEALAEPVLATALLRPFRVRALSPAHSKALVKLVKRYGEDWARSLLADWNRRNREWSPPDRDELAWLAALPRLCKALLTANDAVGTLSARLVLQDRWAWLEGVIKERRGFEPPSARSKALASLAEPIRGFLESTAVIAAGDLRDQALDFLLSAENEPLLACLVQTLRAAAKKVAPAQRAALGFDAIAQHCARRLEARLAVPERAAGDWSIALPEACRCELCRTLAVFLANPDKQQLEWPLAEQKRRHVHQRLDRHELPVRHETRRKGSPYTLVLTKTTVLFEREAAERKAWQADLEWLTSR